MATYWNLIGTSERLFQIGGGENYGSCTLQFHREIADGNLVWTPTANRTLTLPDATGTIGLRPRVLDYTSVVTGLDITADLRAPGYTTIACLDLGGGGGGGGSGRRGATSTGRSGGGGGAAGNVLRLFYIPISALPAGSAILDIAAGGNGSNARTTDDTNGTSGNAGGISRLTIGGVIVFEAAGGAGGTGGGTSTGTAGAANTYVNGRGNFMGGAGGAGNAGTGSNAPNPVEPGGGGGAGGGGISATNIAGAGGLRSYWRPLSQLNDSTTVAINDYYGAGIAGLGGVGAGASVSGAGTPAGNGGFIAGGGGGNATLNGVTGQKAGDGGSGRCRIILI